MAVPGAPSAGGLQAVQPAPEFVWDARAVEHLLNRAGFGGTGAEIARGLELGPEGLIDELLSARRAWVDTEPALFRWEDFGLDHMQVTLESAPYYQHSTEEQIAMCKDARVVDRNQFLELYQRWFASMARSDDPLRDRMTLFWHGFFTTSWEVVKRKYELIRQFQWLRREALGSYADLLHGIVRDPAMLQFLDQTASSKQHPNENLARELLELFSLGEGHYTELDVREAARALTGNRCASDGSFEFLSGAHDAGPKTILDRTETFDDRALVEHLLAQEECPRWVARRLLRWFEGLEPEPERLERYARVLRQEQFELRPFLRTLALDPAFYRDEVVGTRVLSPIEHLAFACHKLEIEPDGHFLNKAGVILGQSFYLPPSVKGWPEGLDWITNDALLRRGNVLGALLGMLEATPEATAIEAASGRAATERAEVMVRGDLEILVRTLEGRRWEPGADLRARLAASGARTDAEVAAWLLEEWLPGPPARGTPRVVSGWIASERATRGLLAGAWLDDDVARTELLRALAHLIFSLPEAHLG
ncbi:MAG: DUF1800 domain-containing protein [Planctomycetes bacterium]|nr:DUF1800 domain-containing protein [Planctomycetota bacterium]